MMAIRVEPLTQCVGARITGVNLSTDLSAANLGIIRDAWARWGVLVFPEQALNDAAHARFARTVGGATEPHLYRAGNVDDHDRLISAAGAPARLLRLNWLWHIDGSYREAPTRGSILQCLECAGEGGDTIFASLTAAHAALPPPRQQHLATLFARHSFEFLVTDQGHPPLTAQDRSALPPVTQPLVAQHRDGSRSLFLSPPYMESVLGLGAAQSRELIADLTQWATQPSFTYPHRWRPGDIVMWDNRRTMHRVTPYDIETTRRIMRGAVLIGREPVLPVT